MLQVMTDMEKLQKDTVNDRELESSRTITLNENAVLEVLSDGSNFIAELRSFISATVEFYRIGNEIKGGEHLLSLIEGLEWVVNLTDRIGTLLKVDFSGTCMDGRTLTESVESLNVLLLEIVTAQEQRDWVLLSDLLEYELEPQLGLWQEVFGMLRKRNCGNDGLRRI